MTTSVLAAETNNFLLPNATFFVELLLFVAILFVLYRFVVPPLSRAMHERDEMVRKQAADSQEAVRRLQQAQERFESELAQARAEAARIRDDARADANRVREEMRERANADVERIRQRGAEQLATQRELTVRQLRSEIGGLSLQLAERVTGEPLSGPRNRSTVERFLADLELAAAPGSADGGGSRETTPAGGGAS